MKLLKTPGAYHEQLDDVQLASDSHPLLYVLFNIAYQLAKISWNLDRLKERTKEG